MQNIIFSTTRQWNPGDEIILAGVRNVFAELGVRHNAVIFNRNPDVRSCFQDRQIFKVSKVPNDFWTRPDTISLESNLKFGFFDNSLKPDTDCSFADWVVLAGTPEWCSGRMYDLYANILRHDIPVMILGVGGGCRVYHDSFREVIGKAKTLTVRDADTLKEVEQQGFRGRRMPCPALLAAPEDSERRIDEVRQIGLIYHASREESVIWNGFSQEAYDYTVSLYRYILARYGDRYRFSMVCHYVDGLPLCRRDFPGIEMVYSYDAADYRDIYANCDLVLGPRVHGIGMAASLGIPGIALVHDSRGSTCEGFLARMHRIGDPHDQVAFSFEEEIERVTARNTELLAHKRATMAAYAGLVETALGDHEVKYSGRPPDTARAIELAETEPLLDALHALSPEKIPLPPHLSIPRRIVRKMGRMLMPAAAD